MDARDAALNFIIVNVVAPSGFLYYRGYTNCLILNMKKLTARNQIISF